jgi:hypothetical protein
VRTARPRQVLQSCGHGGRGRGAGQEAERGAGGEDSEPLIDLLDGVAAFAVQADLFIHLPGQRDLPRSELRFLATGTATGPGRPPAHPAFFPPSASARTRRSRQDLEKHAADGGGGVDALVEQDKVDTTVVQVPR